MNSIPKIIFPILVIAVPSMIYLGFTLLGNNLKTDADGESGRVWSETIGTAGKPQFGTMGDMRGKKGRPNSGDDPVVTSSFVYANKILNGTVAWRAMSKAEAVEFCESLNRTLPDRKIYLIGMAKGYGGENFWLSTEFTFPEISVDENSPIKEDVTKILKSFKSSKTTVHIFNFSWMEEKNMTSKYRTECASAHYVNRNKFRNIPRRFVCKDDEFDELGRMKVKRTIDPKCEALQEMSQIFNNKIFLSRAHFETSLKLDNKTIARYNLFDDSFNNVTFVLSDINNSFSEITPDFYLGDVETYDPNLTGIPYCDHNPIMPESMIVAPNGLVAHPSSYSARAACFRKDDVASFYSDST